MSGNRLKPCPLAPVGWTCTRPAGHDGACVPIQVRKASNRFAAVVLVALLAIVAFALAGDLADWLRSVVP